MTDTRNISRNRAADSVRSHPSTRFGRWATIFAALTACTLTVTGCAPFGFAPLKKQAQTQTGEEPEGGAESYRQQKPSWSSCYDSFECADVYAPIDWADPKGNNITLHMVKQPAKGSKRLGTLFVNPGGPGASGVEFIANSIDSSVSLELQQHYDVIGWDPRGVGSSSAVKCVNTSGMDEYLFGLGSDAEQGSDEWIDDSIDVNTEFAESCSKNTGELLNHVDTMSTVRDLDMLRAIVGDKKLNYLGYSYGTYIGALYADTFPKRSGRLVLDGATDPSTSSEDVNREQIRGFESALRAYLTDCLGRKECPFTGTVDGSMQRIAEMIEQVDDEPIQGPDGRWFTSSTLLTAIITPLYSKSSWNYLDDLFVQVQNGEVEQGFRLADVYYSRSNGKYLNNMTEAFVAINCLDYPNDLNRQHMRENAEQVERAAPILGQYFGYGATGCAGWPTSKSQHRGPVSAKGADPILVVGTTGDPATPYIWAKALAEQLEKGVLVSFEGEGHTAYMNSSCVVKTVDAYLVEGKVPAKDPLCTV